ncbi:MAG TPA: ATP-binding protein [Acidimicrobiia bacterium]
MSDGPGKNPYRPGVGTKPAYLAGRDGPMRRFRSVLRAAPEQPANMRLTGLRGVGKTVLLGEFEGLAKAAGWGVGFLELNPRHNTDEALAAAAAGLSTRIREETSRAERVKAKLGKAVRSAGSLGVTYNDVKLSLDPSAEVGAADVARDLFDLVDLVVEKGRNGAVLLLDEAQVVRDERDRDGEHPLSLLISAVAALQRKDLPLGLVLCGLPTLTGNLLRARSYTEHMFRGEEIGRLDPGEAAAAFTEPLRDRPIDATPQLVEAVVREVEGYPYFIQLWGAELWDAADSAEVTTLDERLLEVTTPDIYRRLDIDFYEPRVSTLTPAEQDVLLATADCPYPPLSTLDLKEAVDKTPGNINVLLGRLVEAGVLYRVRKGQYEYTAPKFREYLLRGQPDA